MARAPRWKIGKWMGRDNYVCNRCAFATLDRGEMVKHADHAHPQDAGDEPHGLAGVDFASDEAAELAIASGLDARTLGRFTPSGSAGGYTVADVRAAAKSVTPEE